MSLIVVNDKFPFHCDIDREIGVVSDGWPKIVKRLIDIVVALSALLILSPLFVFVAILIRATMGPGVIYGHRRVGREGQPFRCLKFRTMVNDSEAVLRAHLSANPEAAREWDASHKLKADPRVTRLGSRLRNSSVDELPQLLNVLIGQMSCVGPRPITFQELQRYDAAACEYMRLRPGLTGAWQVSGRGAVSYGERVALDVAYARDWTLRRDLLIVLKTIPALMRVEQAS